MTPDKYLPHRYAGASGDFNPIHIDPEFAKAVGLPGNILHGLWMMAQVARGNAQLADGDPRALKRLSVQFRGMGFPEQELVVTGTVKEVDGRPRGDRHRGRAGRQPGDPQRPGRAEFAARSARRSYHQGAVLSERQNQILSLVVERYVDDGRPVGSRALASRADIDWSPSTVRAELAGLEEEGFLTHPHTSAGRVPTDTRLPLLRRAAAGPAGPAPAADQPASCGLSRMRREVDVAIRETTATLSQVTDLVALVTAPPLHTATIHRIEVLRLQPRVVMVVVIASNGGVTKRVFTFDREVDTGLVEWAASYLNERLAGLASAPGWRVGPAPRPRARLGRRRISSREISSAFTDLEESAEDTLYVDGAARLLSEEHLPGPAARRRPDAGPGASGERAAGPAHRARPALGLRLDRRRESRLRSCAR